MQVIAPSGVFLPALGRPVAKGETVDVPEDVGQSLVEQGWVSERSRAAKRAARKRTAKKAPAVTTRAQQATDEPAAAEQED